ncbi:uncharacterized protein K441DRAFT_163304 [Cenococcum geophilum 1.58]|uniref:uncharacterized protein n=1 Tax=Cenococcum geophilum 1.58 TaxID=794803 RepID=UPI00358FE060|nr:hypothetical protein K441DRAFT_163304 [Cenococcum geophilum 1.58]
MIRTRSVPVRAWKGVSRPLRGVREELDLDLSLAIERVVQHITSDLAIYLRTTRPCRCAYGRTDPTTTVPIAYGRTDAGTVLPRIDKNQTLATVLPRIKN